MFAVGYVTEYSTYKHQQALRSVVGYTVVGVFCNLLPCNCTSIVLTGKGTTLPICVNHHDRLHVRTW